MDWLWLQRQPEGQFLERKSCYDRSSERSKRRSVREVARDIAETLSAMANSDGGTLALGLENDGTATGVDYPDDRLQVLMRACNNLVLPALFPKHQWVILQDRRILVFEVDWSPDVHQLRDGRYLLRVNDQNLPFPFEDIHAIKESKRRRLTEMRFLAEASIDALDTRLLAELRSRAALERLSDLELLIHYKLAVPRNGRYVLSLAALLLFAKDPSQWYSHSYVDFVKWEGTERKFGADLNVIKRERTEGPLPKLIEKVFATVKPHIRERQKLVDLFFEERFEYPPFAWQEAIINAVAHRDYGLEGTPIEIWMFDDRMEIRSPGQLVDPVTIERLKRRERIHASRNPRIVRVLTDWGFMRELGEGIPRMFEVMETEGLKPPEFSLQAEVIFTVVLFNTPVYSQETLRWLNRFEDKKLNRNQKRLLAYAHAHGGFFTSRQYQELVGVDIYTAATDIKDLLRKGIIEQTKKGGRVYRLIENRKTEELPAEITKVHLIIKQKGYVTNGDIRNLLGISRVHASRLLQEWVARGYLLKKGDRKGAKYTLK